MRRIASNSHRLSILSDEDIDDLYGLPRFTDEDLPLFILDFIDDVNLRQCVQKSLNRGEAYQRLRRAVAFVNGGKFRVKTETEQQIWNECPRLITNAIIYYNTVLLSRVYEQKQAAGDQAALFLIEGVFPVA